MPEAPRFIDDQLVRIGDYEFHCEHPISELPPGRVWVMKNRDLVEEYLHTFRELRPVRIVELGINRGGSTVLISELARPEKLVALELSGSPVEQLDDYIEERGLAGVVRPFYGVDQADRARVAGIVAAEFAGQPIDLVVDDASHLYEHSRSSFETLFPHVRPGGLFLLEDWRWQHQIADGLAAAAAQPGSEKTRLAIARRVAEVAAGRAEREVPMSRLVLELVLARASSGDAVAEVTIGGNWVVVRRGEGVLDGDAFRLADLYHDSFDLLAPAPETVTA